MRLKHWIAGLAAGAVVALAATSASAFDHKRWDPSVAPEGRGDAPVIRHFVYRPHYKHVYHLATIPDPYSYRYVKRKYYPYYGSAYWVPAEQMRYRYRYTYEGPKFRYQESWGRPRHHKHKVHSMHHAMPVK